MSKNNPIQVLLDEHEIICKVESIIQSLNNGWETDVEKYKNKVNELLVFLKEYSDKFHHHKEEEVLFVALKNKPDFLLDDIISEMENHHEMFREYVRQIKELINEKAWVKVQKTLVEYANDLLDHIAVENDELFSIAESLFSEDELERMYFLFEDIDRELGMESKQELELSINLILND